MNHIKKSAEKFSPDSSCGTLARHSSVPSRLKTCTASRLFWGARINQIPVATSCWGFFIESPTLKMGLQNHCRCKRPSFQFQTDSSSTSFFDSRFVWKYQLQCEVSINMSRKVLRLYHHRTKSSISKWRIERTSVTAKSLHDLRCPCWLTKLQHSLGGEQLVLGW